MKESQPSMRVHHRINQSSRLLGVMDSMEWLPEAR